MAEGRLLPYLDVPFQHASPRILKLMKRPASAEDNLARIRAWRVHLSRTHDPQHLHRRLSGRNRGRVRSAARIPGGSTARPRWLLRLLAGRRCARQRAVRTRARRSQGGTARALHGAAGEDQCRAAARESRKVPERTRRRSAWRRRRLPAPPQTHPRSTASCTCRRARGARGRRPCRVRVVQSDSHDLWAEAVALKINPRILHVDTATQAQPARPLVRVSSPGHATAGEGRSPCWSPAMPSARST